MMGDGKWRIGEGGIREWGFHGKETPNGEATG